jgi:hypothetical protein
MKLGENAPERTRGERLPDEQRLEQQFYKHIA